MGNQGRVLKFTRAGEGGSQNVTVTISPDGKVNIETAGFSGEACFAATAELERALGKRTEMQRTPEYSKKVVAGQKAGA